MDDSLLSDKSVFLYINEISKVPDLTLEQEKMLAKKANEGDRKSAEKLAEAYMKRVIPIATDFYKHKPKASKIDFLDLLQAGNTGLLRAVHKYQPNEDYGFWEYAEWWVRHEIKKELK